MKQQKIYTLIILLTTFALLWENEKVLSASVTEAITSVNANDWIKGNFTQLKHQGIGAITVELPAKMHVMIGVISTPN
jgi:hypothetical protein